MEYAALLESDNFDDRRPYDSFRDLIFILDFAKALGYDINMIKYDVRKESSIRKSRRITENRRNQVA